MAEAYGQLLCNGKPIKLMATAETKQDAASLYVFMNFLIPDVFSLKQTPGERDNLELEAILESPCEGFGVDEQQHKFYGIDIRPIVSSLEGIHVNANKQTYVSEPTRKKVDLSWQGIGIYSGTHMITVHFDNCADIKREQ